MFVCSCPVGVSEWLTGPRPHRVIPKTIIKVVTNFLLAWHACLMGRKFGSATQLSKRSGSVWNCL